MLTIWTSNPSPRYLPREVKTCIHKKIYFWIFIFIHNSPKLDIIKMFLIWWMDKQIAVCQFSGLQPSNKEQTVMHVTACINLKTVTLSKNVTWKTFINDVIYMAFWKRYIVLDSSSVVGLGVGNWLQRSTRKLFRMTKCSVMIALYIITLYSCQNFGLGGVAQRNSIYLTCSRPWVQPPALQTKQN